MKYLSAFIIILFIISCSKDSGTTIKGNWNLVNDSVYSNIGIEVYNHNYIGLSNDYFYFNNDGKLYFKEGNLYDTLNYQILSNNRIIIDSISIPDNGEYVPSTISLLTSHNATIQIAPVNTNPGGTY